MKNLILYFTVILIKLYKKEPLFIGCFWFVIFNFLSLASIYKLYIRLISFDQTITIRKLISNHNNLFNNAEYNRYNPKFVFQNKIFSYGQNNNNIVIPFNSQRDLHVNENELQNNNINNNESNNNINNENNNNINNENNNNINRIQSQQNDSISTEQRTIAFN